MNRIEEYAYAPGIDQPIATIRGNTGVDAVGYHVQDELGNILGLIEDGAYISQTNSYDAWGTPTETGHAYNNQLKWKGLKWEGDVISLYYMRNRWYDYETGRFMSEDPIGLAGGINLYAFANNDPVNGWDPYGLDGCTAEYLAAGWYTVDIDGKEWCAAPLPTVEIKARGGGGGGSWRSGRGGGWPRGGGDGGAWGGGGGEDRVAKQSTGAKSACFRRAFTANQRTTRTAIDRLPKLAYTAGAGAVIGRALSTTGTVSVANAIADRYLGSAAYQLLTPQLPNPYQGQAVSAVLNGSRVAGLRSAAGVVAINASRAELAWQAFRVGTTIGSGLVAAQSCL